jgi:hypothetical protein
VICCSHIELISTKIAFKRPRRKSFNKYLIVLKHYCYG